MNETSSSQIRNRARAAKNHSWFCLHTDIRYTVRFPSICLNIVRCPKSRRIQKRSHGQEPAPRGGRRQTTTDARCKASIAGVEPSC